MIAAFILFLMAAAPKPIAALSDQIYTGLTVSVAVPTSATSIELIFDISQMKDPATCATVNFINIGGFKLCGDPNPMDKHGNPTTKRAFKVSASRPFNSLQVSLLVSPPGAKFRTSVVVNLE